MVLKGLVGAACIAIIAFVGWNFWSTWRSAHPTSSDCIGILDQLVAGPDMPSAERQSLQARLDACGSSGSMTSADVQGYLESTGRLSKAAAN